MDRNEIVGEMHRAAADFRALLDNATSADLRRGSDGTKWTNEQLLFHMLFGYLLVRNLLVLVRVFSRLPDGYSRRFAGTPQRRHPPLPHDQLPGLPRRSACPGPRPHGTDLRPASAGSHVAGTPERRGPRSGMHFPVGWDPYFRDYMTLADVYHYPTQHYGHHRRQLTLPAAVGSDSPTAHLLPITES